MDKKNKIILVFATIFLVISIAAAILFLYIAGSAISSLKSCNAFTSIEYFTYEDFKYNIVKEKYGDKDIRQFANLYFINSDKDTVIIPEKIGGIPVCIHQPFYFLDKDSHFERIYIESGLLDSQNSSKDSFQNKFDGKIVFISNNNEFCFYYVHNFVTKEKFKYYLSTQNNILIYCEPANVNFYWNYENAPNGGFYWIDDYENGETIRYIPKDPTREGYKFDGWYKEPECVNKWNFETETVQRGKFEFSKFDSEYLEKFDEIYIDNALYAKWIKL